MKMLSLDNCYLLTSKTDTRRHDKRPWAWLLWLVFFPGLCHFSFAGVVSGELTQWHPVTVSFNGPAASETDNNPNPFLDYRLQVTFTGPSGQRYNVPGFFDGNGNGGGSGNVWRVRFSPDEAGNWNYAATLRSGTNVAVELAPNAGSAASLGGATGSFAVAGRDPGAPGFLKWGRLEYVNKHYLKFRDGDYWIKGGVDSPENFLGYKGFDNTVNQSGGVNTAGLENGLHRYLPHVDDWNPGDPDFTSADTGFDSRGIIGALNYLSSENVNSIYFLPMNLGGDGRETYPFVGPGNNNFDKAHYDISKLSQWNQVLNHAQEKGIALHFVLAETESGNENWFDNGNLGVQRKLYYRELIARFSYLLAIKWNLSEETDFSDNNLRAFADYIGALDWANHQITFHTHPNRLNQYDPHLGDTRFDTTSIQYNPNNANDFVETMRNRSRNNGRIWVIDMDENNPASEGLTDTNANDLRKRTLYDVYFSGGNIEWYFGYHSLPLGGDVRTENFRTRQAMYRYMWYARRFMQEQLPFWDMQPNDGLLSGESGAFGGGQVFHKAGEVYAVYLPDASPSGTINLASGSYTKRWYNPRNGQFQGGATIVGGGAHALGSPPNSADQDWVVLLRAEGGGGNESPTAVFLSPSAGEVFSVGDSIQVEVEAEDADGSIANVRLFLNDTLVRQENFDPYRWNDRDQDTALQNLAAGSYELKAVATDNDGASTEAIITITVEDPNANNAPSVSFTEPANGQTIGVGDSLVVTVAAADTDGAVANVRLFINDAFVRQENIDPYRWNDRNQDPQLQNLAAGSYELKAIATDDLGKSSETSVTVNASDNGGEPVTLSFTPTNDAYLQNGTPFNSNELRVEHNRRTAYLKFDVSGISGTVTDVKLELQVSTDPGNGNIAVFRGQSNNWSESTLSTATAPAAGAEVGNRNGTWSSGVSYTLEIDSLVSANGVVSLVLDMDAGGNDVAFSAREGAAQPRLIVTYTP
ncbi:DUF5060 domain-containing protein [Exilibacterium tricleocarpae]|uniref:DUF5060 domain-containing protein n=1 Tax=Exilibacterium tricleocarpae TaxID=2591008 RepID=A0A545SZX6_9GAMM|nr:Ig-like domain-containing protein [Exilibacterium tricleocarpae]TQV70510.1 DUF5060 domain-containing protein [Exilibacterium tricleocarpae]